jgi:branched-chain amino acid transport system permease protein
VPDIKPFIVTGIALGSIYALSGIGLVVLYRATAVLNFAYGAVGALGALVAWDLIDSGSPEPLAWLVCIGVSTALSLIYGVLVAQRLADRDLATKAIATVGFAVLLLGFAQWWLPDVSRSLSLPTSDHGFRVFGVFVVYTRVIALAAAFVVAVGVTSYLNRTRTGLSMRAMADNADQADLLGIRTDRVGMIAWGMSGALSGITGLLIADLIRLDAGAITFLVVPAIAAAIIGRLRSLPATLLGGLVIGLVESVAAPFDSISDYRGVAPYLAALLFLVWQQRESGIQIYSSTR